MPNKKRHAPKKTGQVSDRLEVRESGVHGHGVYARQAIGKGTRIIEYTGKRVSWEKASSNSDNPHTFLFGVEDENKVIDAGIGGNEARWINHSCDPNCEAREEKGRVFIYALRDIEPGEELNYDYDLEIDEPRTKKVEKEYQCHCRARNCRGTMLASVDP